MSGELKPDYTEALFRKLVTQIANDSKLLPKEGPLEISLIGEAISEDHVLNGVTINLTVQVIDALPGGSAPDPRGLGDSPPRGLGDCPPPQLLRSLRRIPRGGPRGEHIGDCKDTQPNYDTGVPLTFAGYAWRDLLPSVKPIKCKHRVSLPGDVIASRRSDASPLRYGPSILAASRPTPKPRPSRSPGTRQTLEAPRRQQEVPRQVLEARQRSLQKQELPRQTLEVRQRSPQQQQEVPRQVLEARQRSPQQQEVPRQVLEARHMSPKQHEVPKQNLEASRRRKEAPRQSPEARQMSPQQLEASRRTLEVPRRQKEPTQTLEARQRSPQQLQDAPRQTLASHQHGVAQEVHPEERRQNCGASKEARRRLRDAEQQARSRLRHASR